MKIHRRKKVKNYTILDNYVLSNAEITPQAVQIYCHIMYLPEDFEISKNYLMNFFKSMGKTQIQNGLNDLEKHGLLNRFENRIGGKFNVDYEFFETPSDNPHRVSKTDTVKASTVAGPPCPVNGRGSSLYNKYSKISTKRVLKDSGQSNDLPTLLAVKKLVSDNKIKINPETVFYYLEARKFRAGKTLITSSNILSYLKSWEAREKTQFNNQSDEKIELKKAMTTDWIDSYQNSLSDWK